MPLRLKLRQPPVRGVLFALLLLCGLLPLVLAHLDALVSNGLSKDAYEVSLQVLAEMEDQSWVRWWMAPVLYKPALDPGTRRHSPPSDFPDNHAPWLADLNGEASTVYQGTADPQTIEFLKGFYPLPEDLAATGPVSAAIVAREALVYAGQLDYVIDIDVWWAGQPELSQHEFNWSPFFAELRQHPRFPEYLEAAGIIAYWDMAGWPDWCARGDDRVVRCR